LKNRYRAEIDGLRALAVLPVVLYHAQFPGFSGGFVGVDVFFVISGFLITGILLSDMEAGTYSVSGFYERRIRRIMPSLLVVLLFVVVAAPFSLLPSELSRLGEDLLGALLFVANIVFWLDSGYFSSGSEAKPLLHTWSLGIEEQFYIFAPVIFLLLTRHARRHLTWLLAAALAASLLACVLLTRSNASTAFFLLPTRAWELLAGALLAVAVRTESGAVRLGARFNQALALAGLMLVVLPVFFYSKATSFPGYAALAPVAGAVLVIAYGEGTLVGRMLSSRAVVFVGLLSYSLYLWHWPLVVFFRNAGWLISWTGSVAVVSASLFLAWLTWRYVERPTRDRALFPSRSLLIWIALGSVIVVLSAVIYRTSDGWSSRVSEQTRRMDQARFDTSPSRDKCHIRAGIRTPDAFCTLGQGDLHVALWGDSHGVELAQALSERGMRVTSVTYSACRPALVDLAESSRNDCSEQNRITMEGLLGDSSLAAIVLVANYSGKVSRLDGLLQVADRLQSAGKRVVIVGPTPSLKGRADLPTYLARGGADSVPFGDISADIFLRHAGPKRETYLPEHVFCTASKCDLTPENSALLFDGHHPSMSASRMTARGLSSCLRNAPCR